MSGHKPYYADCVFLGALREHFVSLCANFTFEGVLEEIEDQVSYFVDGVVPGSVKMISLAGGLCTQVSFDTSDGKGNTYSYSFVTAYKFLSE